MKQAVRVFRAWQAAALDRINARLGRQLAEQHARATLLRRAWLSWTRHVAVESAATAEQLRVAAQVCNGLQRSLVVVCSCCVVVASWLRGVGVVVAWWLHGGCVVVVWWLCGGCVVVVEWECRGRVCWACVC